MSAGRYRGVFWSTPEKPVPGTLEITDSGELYLELWGALVESTSFFGTTEAVERIHGEIADSPFSGPMVSLFRCLQMRRRRGTGGPFERWLVHRALIGRELVESETVFTRVTLGIRGLAAFLGKPPSLIGSESKVVHLSPSEVEAARLSVEGWEVVFGWWVNGRWGSEQVHLERLPRIAVTLDRPFPVEEFLGQVVPVFEAILTIASRTHARLEQIDVHSSLDGDTYRVLGPRVEAVTPGREPRLYELLFRLDDLLGRNGFIERVRQLFSQNREFTDIFLSYERSPARYMEERVRASILALAHLTKAFPGFVERGSESLTILNEAPAQIRAYLPSAALVAVPELAGELLSPQLCRVLDVSQSESFVKGIGSAFRWVSLREDPVPGIDLLHLNGRLRALLHLALLRYLGFEPEDAEQRLVRSIEQSGLL